MNTWWWALWTALQQLWLPLRGVGMNLLICHEQGKKIQMHVSSFLGVPQQTGQGRACRSCREEGSGWYCFEDTHEIKKACFQRASRTEAASHVTATVQAFCWLIYVDSDPSCPRDALWLGPALEHQTTTKSNLGEHWRLEWETEIKLRRETWKTLKKRWK